MVPKPDDAHRCHARSKRSGERCKKWAVAGGVCHKHGAGTPAARAVARRQKQETWAIVRAERVDLSMYTSDPVAALERALKLAQAFMDEIYATGDLRLKLAGLERVASISTTMTKLQLARAKDMDAEMAEQMGREAAARISGRMLALARRAVWEAASGGRAAAPDAIAALERGYAEITSDQEASA